MSLKPALVQGIAIPSHSGGSWITGSTGTPILEKSRKTPDMARLIIEVPTMKFPYYGWVSLNTKIGQALIKMEESQSLVTAIFEQKRKDSISEEMKSKDITELRANSEIANENTIKVLAGIYDYSSKKWLLTDNASFDEKAIPDSWTSTLIHNSQDVDFSLEDLAPKDITPKPVIPQSVDRQSYLINFYMFIKGQELKYGYELTDERRKLIATKLLKMADGFQQKVTKLTTPNYKDYSHTRARQLVFQVLENFVHLDEKVTTDEGLKTVLNESIKLGLSLLSWN